MPKVLLTPFSRECNFRKKVKHKYKGTPAIIREMDQLILAPNPSSSHMLFAGSFCPYHHSPRPPQDLSSECLYPFHDPPSILPSYDHLRWSTFASLHQL